MNVYIFYNEEDFELKVVAIVAENEATALAVIKKQHPYTKDEAWHLSHEASTSTTGYVGCISQMLA